MALGGKVSDLGKFIREQREHARLSLRKLSNMAGISNPYLSQIERGLRRPSAEILQAIAKSLRISAETLYVKAGILEERDTEDIDTSAAILRDLTLNDKQKQVLIDIYQSFRHENELEGAGTAGRAAQARAKQRRARTAAAKRPGSSKKPAKRTKAASRGKKTSGRARASSRARTG